MADFTQSQLDAIRAAIARGEKTVQFADRSVTYRSIEELLEAEKRITQALRTSARSKQTLIVTSNGF